MTGLFAPDFLDKFDVLAPIGEGGMGTVYRGVQRSLGRPVAIKVLTPQLANSNFQARFQTEARLAAQVFHSNLVAVIEYGRMGDVPFIVFEFVDGTKLRQHVEEGGALLPLKRCLELAGQAADGLEAAHRAGIIHRDLKPENLLVTTAGNLKVADFGVAKDHRSGTERVTQAGFILGTPLYMSPEQAQEQEVTPATDVYSLGIVLYELLSGSLPFGGGSMLEILEQHVRAEPPPLPDEIPRGVKALVSRALAKDPYDRFESMAELSRELATVRSTIESDALARPRPRATQRVRTIDRRTLPISLNTMASRVGVPVAPRRHAHAWIPAGLLACGVVYAGLALRPSPEPAPPSTPTPRRTTSPARGGDLSAPWRSQVAAYTALTGTPPAEAMLTYGRLVAATPDSPRAAVYPIWADLERGELEAAVKALAAWLNVPLISADLTSDVRVVNDLLLERLFLQLLERVPDARMAKLEAAASGFALQRFIQAVRHLRDPDYAEAHRAFRASRDLGLLRTDRRDLPTGLRVMISLTYLARLAPGWKTRPTTFREVTDELDRMVDYVTERPESRLRLAMADVAIVGCVQTHQKPRATKLFASLPKPPAPAHQVPGPVLSRCLDHVKARLVDRPARSPSPAPSASARALPHLPGGK